MQQDECQLKSSSKTTVVAAQDMKKIFHVVSHDLRNPLLNIQALTHELHIGILDAQEAQQGNQGQALSDILTNDLPDTITLLQESTQRMDAMIAGMNEIYHCMYDELECETIDIQHMFERCFALSNLADEGVVLHCHTHATAQADPWAVQRIMTALLFNAAKAMAHAKHSASPHINITTTEQDGWLYIHVKDDGCGFQDDEIEHVFEPFFSGIGFQHGAGLGLVRAQSLVERHGGFIRIEQVQQGATLTFSLPLA